MNSTTTAKEHRNIVISRGIAFVHAGIDNKATTDASLFDPARKEGMWTALLVSMVMGPTVDKEAEIKKDKNDIKIIAKGVWPVMEEKPVQRVLRSSEELAIALGVEPQDAKEKRFQKDAVFDTARLLKVKGIDWEKQMLIVVAAGAKRTGGYRVEIEALRVKDGALTVKWKLHNPAPGNVVTQAVSYPTQMALVECYQGTVRFDPPLEKK